MCPVQKERSTRLEESNTWTCCFLCDFSQRKHLHQHSRIYLSILMKFSPHHSYVFLCLIAYLIIKVTWSLTMTYHMTSCKSFVNTVLSASVCNASIQKVQTEIFGNRSGDRYWAIFSISSPPFHLCQPSAHLYDSSWHFFTNFISSSSYNSSSPPRSLLPKLLNPCKWNRRMILTR